MKLKNFPVRLDSRQAGHGRLAHDAAARWMRETWRASLYSNGNDQHATAENICFSALCLAAHLHTWMTDNTRNEWLRSRSVAANGPTVSSHRRSVRSGAVAERASMTLLLLLSADQQAVSRYSICPGRHDRSGWPCFFLCTTNRHKNARGFLSLHT